MLGAKARPDRDADHSHPSSAEVETASVLEWREGKITLMLIFYFRCPVFSDLNSCIEITYKINT
jgi:hypothetical protein